MCETGLAVPKTWKGSESNWACVENRMTETSLEVSRANHSRPEQEGRHGHEGQAVGSHCRVTHGSGPALASRTRELSAHSFPLMSRDMGVRAIPSSTGNTQKLKRPLPPASTCPAPLCCEGDWQ